MPSKCSSTMQSDAGLAGFVAYNLGIALLQAGRTTGSDRATGQSRAAAGNDPAGLAIRDKTNLVLGTMLFESGNFERAKQSLDRVRLDGLFSNQALLRAGLAEAHRPNSMIAPSFRGTSWWIGSRRMPQFRKPCLPCRMPMPA